MSALCTALDNEMPKLQLGENMNVEYSWSNDIEELITQFSFQLTRTICTKELEDKYQELLQKIFTKQTIQQTTQIKTIYKLIGYTRDIISGKGEYNLTYMLISGLYKFSQSKECLEEDKYRILALSTSAINSLVRTKLDEHPYGSWKDMKYFCNYHIKKEDRYDYKLNDPLLNKVLDLVCAQIRCDEHSPKKTLAAKWVPREKSSKFGWITPLLAMRYYSPWMKDTNQEQEQKILTPSHPQYKKAQRKCLTHFRQLVAKINKELNTPQINQCNASWENIDFDNNVTSITLRKQSKAFQSVKNNGEPRIYNEDRIKCAENYKEYIERCKTGKSDAKGKRVSIIDFVKAAINLPRQDEMGATNNLTANQLDANQLEADSINLQWENNAKQNKALEDCIAMVDMSASMEQESSNPLYSAVGLGIRIAEKSKFGKRVLTFSATPTWINLDNCNDFVSMVHKLQKAPCGMNTNFGTALDLILDTAIANNINPQDMKNISLIILSDMQIDKQQNHQNQPMFEMMQQKYYDAGMQTIYQEPYKVPHIIFWNLRSTSGFPTLSITKNTSMMSGNSPSLLNTFCGDGINSLKEITPYTTLIKQLSNKRYDYLENIVDNLWINYNKL